MLKIQKERNELRRKLFSVAPPRNMVKILKRFCERSIPTIKKLTPSNVWENSYIKVHNVEKSNGVENKIDILEEKIDFLTEAIKRQSNSSIFSTSNTRICYSLPGGYVEQAVWAVLSFQIVLE